MFIFCGSLDYVVGRMENGEIFNEVRKHLIKIRDIFDMEDGYLTRDTVLEFFSLDLFDSDFIIDCTVMRSVCPSLVAMKFRDIIFAAYDDVFPPEDAKAGSDKDADVCIQNSDVPEVTVSLTMHDMIRILDFQFGFTFSQFEYLEFCESLEELSYCLFFRCSGFPRKQYVFRVYREADEDGFFLTDVRMPGQKVDCRMVNACWFEYVGIGKVTRKCGSH